MGLFDINYPSLVKQLLPVRLRNGVHEAWLNALIGPVIYLYGLFYTNRANDLYVLAHDGQVCYLHAALNDVFDDTLRRIYISDAPHVDADWWALDDEDEPDWWALDSETAPVWWALDSEIAASAEGFIVNVPGVLVFDTARMQALINKYRLPGTSYMIVTF